MQFLYKKSLTQINDNGKRKAHFKIIQGKNSIVQEIDGISHNGKTFQIKKVVKNLKKTLPENNVSNNLSNNVSNNIKNNNNNNNSINTKNLSTQKSNNLVINPPNTTHKLFRLNSRDIMKLLEESKIKLKKKTNHKEKSVSTLSPGSIEPRKERKARTPKIIPLKIEAPIIKVPKELRLKKNSEKQPTLDIKKIKNIVSKIK